MIGEKPISQYLLCLDQGGSSSRAIVISSTGDIISQASVKVATALYGSDRVEQNPVELISSLRQSAEMALSALPADILAVLDHCALVTQRSSMVACQNQNKTLLGPIISWRDTRGATWLEQTLDCSMRERVAELTGLVANAHYGASKIKWLIENDQPIKAAYENDDLLMLPLAAYLVSQLTDEANYFVDPANASRTLLMNLSDQTWSSELLALFGLEQLRLPEIVNTQYDYGSISFSNKTLRLSLVNGDQSAAVFAKGVPDEKNIYANLGTGAFLYTPISVLGSKSRLLTSIVYSDQSKRSFMLEGTVNGAGAALDYQAVQLGVDNYIETINQAFTENHAHTIFINAIGGLGSPDWRHDLPSYFVENDVGVQQKLVAVLESIVFLLLRNLESMQTQIDKLEAIHISGGLSQFDGLCQCLADLSGLPVFRSTEHEATAMGAAFLFFQPVSWPVDEEQSFHGVDNKPLKQRYLRWHQEMQALLN